MAYLPRVQRRAQIVEAALDLMVRDGLAGTTVRAVASAIGASPGQIHHHFESADALRAEAFRQFGRHLSERAAAASRDLAGMDLLINILLCEQENMDLQLDRLMHEVVSAAHLDTLLREAVGDVMEMWRMRVADAITAMLQGCRPDCSADVTRMSQRLVAIAIGSDVVSGFGMGRAFEPEILRRYIELELEVAQAAQRPPRAAGLRREAPAARGKTQTA